MKKFYSGIALLALLAGLITMIMMGCSGGNLPPADNYQQSPTGGKELAPHEQGQIIIRLKQGVEAQPVASLVGGSVIKEFSIGVMQYALIQLHQSKTVETALEELDKHPWIDYAEPNYIMQNCVTPNDPSYTNRQYAHQNMNSEEGWDVTTGNSDVTIAILDTGIDGTHPEFSGRMIAGRNTLTGTPLTGNENSDDNDHGTHVTGITAATGNNSIGIAGVNWQANIMPVKVLNASGGGTLISVVSGIIFAVDNDAAVINMSLGGKGYSQLIKDAIDYARQKTVPDFGKGIVVIVSMGNQYYQNVSYPAAFSGVMAVGSTDPHDAVSNFSTKGRWISVSAPGHEIYSTASSVPYKTLSGTSMSAPQVTGLASLLRGQNKALTPEEIRSIIEGTADDLGTPGFNNQFGYGRINIGNALTTPVANKYGTVAITVLNIVPQSGVDVILENSDTEATIATTKTNSNGIAYFYDVPQGEFVASAALLAQTKKTLLFTVTPGVEINETIDFID